MRPRASLAAALAVSSLAIAGCASVGDGEYTSTWSPPQAQHTVRLSSGFTLRYLRAGRGPPLVLLHTLRTQLDYFERLVPALASHYDVFAVDLPGHGQSSILPAEYTEPLFRQAVAEFITRLDLREATLVGESIGGTLALTVAAELPDRLVRVVALNPYDYGEDFGGGVRRSRNGWIIGLFDLFGAYTFEPEFLLAAVFSGGFHDASRLPGGLVAEFHRAGQRPGFRRVEYSTFKNWRTWVDARRRYAGIRTPVELVYSREDWSRPEERERNRRAIPHAVLIHLEGAGHFASLERPEEVSRLILSGDFGTGADAALARHGTVGR